jgi:hypothetical protein
MVVGYRELGAVRQTWEKALEKRKLEGSMPIPFG